MLTLNNNIYSIRSTVLIESSIYRKVTFYLSHDTYSEDTESIEIK